MRRPNNNQKRTTISVELLHSGKWAWQQAQRVVLLALSLPLDCAIMQCGKNKKCYCLLFRAPDKFQFPLATTRTSLSLCNMLAPSKYSKLTCAPVGRRKCINIVVFLLGDAKTKRLQSSASVSGSLSLLLATTTAPTKINKPNLSVDQFERSLCLLSCVTFAVHCNERLRAERLTCCAEIRERNSMRLQRSSGPFVRAAISLLSYLLGEQAKAKSH